MKITIENSNIKIGSDFFINADGNDLTESKLLDLFSIMDKNQNVEIDESVDLQSDDGKKCELIKLLINEYIKSYYGDGTVISEDGAIDESLKDEQIIVED